MTQDRWIILALVGTAALLAGAFLFQALGYAPCQMCYWQRYPHVVALIAGVAALALGRPGFILIGAVASFTTGAIGLFHSGVEQKWWDGPASCSGGGLGNLDGASLLSVDVMDKVVMCDEISWAFVGLSMPTWNAILSFCIVGLWVKAWLTR
ncbi:MAG: disulfide bond formation protein B [Pseudomonadota bacterium]